MNEIINDEILRQVKEECNDEVEVFNFLKRILFFEAERSKRSRYSEKYVELIKKHVDKKSGEINDF
ncbi:MAG: hypothetical protein ACOCQA_00110 [bacterium]